jgi:hypothetical protein
VSPFGEGSDFTKYNMKNDKGLEVLRKGTECSEIFQIRLDIKPLCDEHDSSTDIRELDIDCAHNFYVYVCCEPDCQRTYSRMRGYYHFEDDNDVRANRCPYDGQAMFKADIDEAGGSIWECPRIGCGRQIRTSEAGEKGSVATRRNAVESIITCPDVGMLNLKRYPPIYAYFFTNAKCVMGCFVLDTGIAVCFAPTAQ